MTLAFDMTFLDNGTRFGTTFFIADAGLAAAGVPGDYNNNGVVDAADYVLWRNGGPLQNDATPGVQPGDYDVWRAHFGQTAGSGAGGSANAAVPEPATVLLLAMVAGIGVKCRWTIVFASSLDTLNRVAA